MRRALAAIALFALFGVAMLVMYGLIDTWPLLLFLGAVLAIAATPAGNPKGQ